MTNDLRQNQRINLAKEYFFKKDFTKAKELFISLNDFYSSGLCSLLLKDIKSARFFWEKSKKYSPASKWGLSLLQMIELNPKNHPSFFQTRAFLEVYLNLFLENNLIEYAQNLISCCDFLYESNPESYKFLARGLYANSYFDLAIKFALKTIQLFYGDPEAMLILAQCYYLVNDIAQAKYYTYKILDIAPDYFPAKLFLMILNENS